MNNYLILILIPIALTLLIIVVAHWSRLYERKHNKEYSDKLNNLLLRMGIKEEGENLNLRLYCYLKSFWGLLPNYDDEFPRMFHCAKCGNVQFFPNRKLEIRVEPLEKFKQEDQKSLPQRQEHFFKLIAEQMRDYLLIKYEELDSVNLLIAGLPAILEKRGLTIMENNKDGNYIKITRINNDTKNKK